MSNAKIYIKNSIRDLIANELEIKKLKERNKNNLKDLKDQFELEPKFIKKVVAAIIAGNINDLVNEATLIQTFNKEVVEYDEKSEVKVVTEEVTEDEEILSDTEIESLVSEEDEETTEEVVENSLEDQPF